MGLVMQAGLRCGIGRPDKAVFRKRSPKHLSRYVGELAARKNDRDEDTIEHMAILAKSMIGRRLVYRDLIARNGLPMGQTTQLGGDLRCCGVNKANARKEC